MRSALILSGSEKGMSALAGLLSPYGLERIDRCSAAEEAKLLLQRTDYDLLILNTPLADEFGDRFAANAAQKYSNLQLLLLVKEELYDRARRNLTPCGVYTLPKPLSKTAFEQAYFMADTARERLLLLSGQTQALREKLDDLRLVGRAKCILIEYLKLSEPEAHRYIEKQAMDLRISRREVAENILKTYEA